MTTTVMRTSLPTVRGLLLAAFVVLAGAPCAHAQRLYWIDTNYGAPALRSARTDGSDVHTLSLPVGSLPEGLALDPGGRHLYWVDAAFGSAGVHRCDLGLGNVTSIAGGLSALRGLDVDAVGDRLFWTASNLVTGTTYHRSALDGSGAVTLGTFPGSANFRGISVDPIANILAIADFGKNEIRTFDLDGLTVQLSYVLPGSPRPYGVVLDVVNQQIYWTEYASGRILRKGYSTEMITELVTGLSNPTYLTLDMDTGHMYWVESGAGAQMIRGSTLDGMDVQTVAAPVATYGGIVFVPAAVLGEVEGPLVRELALGRVVPNPSRGFASIELGLPRDTEVHIRVSDVQGRTVATLADGPMPAGRHRVSWNAAGKARPAAGVYFIKVNADGREWVRRVVMTP